VNITNEEKEQKMQFKEIELAVLKNFAGIHPTMQINPDGISVINNTDSCIGMYKFSEPYDTEPYVIYEVPEFLSVLNAFKAPDITVFPEYVLIKEGTSKVKYFTVAKELAPKVPEVRKRCAQVAFDLDFSISQEKLTMLHKMASILKTESLFMESSDKGVLLTIGDELESSNNTWEILITDDVNVNELPKPVKLLISETRVLPMDYRIKVASAGISHWCSSNGPEYYITAKKTIPRT
jgi:hypothetical protein